MTTIPVTYGGSFTTILQNAPAGIAADLTVAVLSSDEQTIHSAASGEGIVERLDPDSGEATYSAVRHAPTSELPAGDWWVVLWQRTSTGEQRRDLLVPVGPLTSAAVGWAPSVQDVADLCPAYTRPPVDGGGESAGEQKLVFDDTTNPTADTVEGFIAAAVLEVSGRVGAAIGARDADLARRTAAWHAAATVEAERAPEGVEEASSAYRWKQAGYVACLNELISQARYGALRLT